MFKQILQKLIPSFMVSWYHFLWAFFGAVFYGFPSRKTKVIGITGTHGKTTTANLAAKILEEAGYKVALASSINFRIAGKERENKFKMTMPGRAFLQKFLRDAVRAGCEYAILEATSEGVLQHRHRFIKFDVMVFTNLFREHLERHRGFENYKKAKGEYFKGCKGVHIINLDDKDAEYFLQFEAKEKYGYGLKIFNFQFDSEAVILNPSLSLRINSVKDLARTTRPFGECLRVTPPVSFSNSNFQTIKAEDIRENSNSISFAIHNSLFKIPLIGRFNVYNALAAICIALSQGVALEVCQKALAKAGGVPGRMEEVISKPFRVVVDYAFTPDALEQVYKTLLPTTNYQLPTNLICVLGACGGGRDKWKRPVLGEIASKHCREIIITNEDPYDEPPMEIINQVAEGAEALEGAKLLPGKELSSFQISEILDRREAIRKALELAKPGDTVIITGKGCEPWICVENGKKIPWDDRQVVREELQKIDIEDSFR